MRLAKIVIRPGAALLLLTLAVSLGGCSKCGFIWDDWRTPGACRSDAPKPQ